MQQGAHITITQDDVAKTITLNFPLDSLPTDQEVHLSTVNGILDGENGVLDLEPMSGKLIDIVAARYPASDEAVYALRTARATISSSASRSPC